MRLRFRDLIGKAVTTADGEHLGRVVDRCLLAQPERLVERRPAERRPGVGEGRLQLGFAFRGQTEQRPAPLGRIVPAIHLISRHQPGDQRGGRRRPDAKVVGEIGQAGVGIQPDEAHRHELRE
jgi:hypothetical protein